MLFLVLKAYLKLIHFDFYLARGNFAALYDKVRNYPIGAKVPAANAVERICSAVDMACIWYWKEALCLQRSAATACFPEEVRRAGKDGHWCATDALQGSCVGRSGRPRGQR